MKKIVNECCDCAVPLYPCMGDMCPNRHVIHYYCDKCKEEFEPEELYQYENEEVCAECILKDFEKIESEE